MNYNIIDIIDKSFIFTHKGLNRYTRVIFGLSNEPCTQKYDYLLIKISIAVYNLANYGKLKKVTKLISISKRNQKRMFLQKKNLENVSELGFFLDMLDCYLSAVPKA